MNGAWIHAALCALLVLTVSCSKQEETGNDAGEWDDIQALDTDAAVVPVPAKSVEKTDKSVPVADPVSAKTPVDEEDYSGFLQRLEQAKHAERAVGETLLTGKTLVFNYQQRLVELNGNVQVLDDEGLLSADSLLGRFSASNDVDYVEAKGHVVVVSEGREARADNAYYDYKTRRMSLEGKASVEEGANSLSGERIQLWISGSRKMICDPNAVLQISGEHGLDLMGKDAGGELTEIRAGQVIYDEEQNRIDLIGEVRLRDPRLSMNCERVQLHLKDTNEIDWIEATSEVIIQLEDRKALADRATYYADEKKFELEGDPKVKQGKNIMTGDRITFWQETRRMVCEPNARVLLYPDETTKAKFLKDMND